MGLSDSRQKQSSTGATTTSYGWQTPPTTPALEKLAGTKFEVDPGLHAQYGALRNQLKSGFSNPMGANYSPEVRDAMLRSGSERLGQQEAQAYRGGQYDANKLGFARDSAVAGMSAPTLTQTGGTSTGSGTITQSQSPVSLGISAAGALAPLSM